jgi:hypothetical protein
MTSNIEQSEEIKDTIIEQAKLKKTPLLRRIEQKLQLFKVKKEEL